MGENWFSPQRDKKERASLRKPFLFYELCVSWVRNEATNNLRYSLESLFYGSVFTTHLSFHYLLRLNQPPRGVFSSSVFLIELTEPKVG